MPKPMNPFEFHGVEFIDDVKAFCPWCRKNKFKIDPKTLQYGCFHCEAEGKPWGKGNLYTFLGCLVDEGFALSIAGTSQYQALSESRNLPVEALQSFLYPHPFKPGSLLLPIRESGSGKIQNVYVASLSRGKFRLYATPSPAKVHLYIPPTQDFDYVPRQVAIVEGHWDAISTLHHIRKVKQPIGLSGDTFVVAIPGCSNPCIKELKTLIRPEQEVLIFMDNDVAGMTAAANIAKEFPTSRILTWPEGTPEKYDVSDVFRNNGPTKGWAFLSENLGSPTTPSNGTPDTSMTKILTEEEIYQPCESFKVMMDEIRNTFHVDDIIEGAIAVGLAVMMTTELLGDQVWLRIRGPAGSGKTTVMDFFYNAWEYIYPLSELRGIHSGFSQAGPDASLIPVMNRKTVVVKEADVIVSSPAKDKILSELRDIWDGKSNSAFRNGIKNRYDDIRMTFILCGTNAIQSLNKAHCGDRFLDYDMSPGIRERGRRITDMALNRTIDFFGMGFSAERSGKNSLGSMASRMACGFLRHLRTTQPIQPLFTEADRMRLDSLGTWVAMIRSIPSGDIYKNEHIEVDPEVPGRISSQLLKTTLALTNILPIKNADGMLTVHDRIWDLTMKLAMDTASGLAQTTMFALAKQEATVYDLQNRLGKPTTTIRYTLQKLLAFGLVFRIKRPGSGTNNQTEVWRLSRQAESLIEACGFHA